ncbi:alpha/beta-hydrolase [Roridomyces roridus]|uniref:Alpha/beta-hydrolase n=1 Tax=Roridomyces roridus TaxID=1738132 RepID=A0AAD7BNS6_9AGAR|nr:alpha/beta-hydrolase [Roridomyces roridus]
MMQDHEVAQRCAAAFPIRVHALCPLTVTMSTKATPLSPLLPQQAFQPLQYLPDIDVIPRRRGVGRTRRETGTRTRWLIGSVLVLSWVAYSFFTWRTAQVAAGVFYANVTRVGEESGICPPGIVSHAGHVGLRGDTEDEPKRAFFWYFEAEHDPQNAPVILTIGGGPGTSGMLNPMFAQGPCLIVENGTMLNPNRWTESFNLIALDHPIGVGFSYGTHVNNSRSAAIDVYDFLQKFYRLFPHLIGNQFVLSGGSYGGIYIPHIATVIHEQNLALRAGAVHINLESMMVSNPVSDAASYYRWMLQTRCYDVPDMYNASTCAELFEVLPRCLDSIQLAMQGPGWIVERHVAAHTACSAIEMGDAHGTVIVDVRKKCYSKDPMGCLPPSFGWADQFFRRPDVRDALGIPAQVNYTILSDQVYQEFVQYGDKIQAAHLLYQPLLAAGIRLLHYVGEQDANCAWRGVLSFLKLIQSPFQESFLRAPDVPWSEDAATVRVVGEGAGDMTYILVRGGGHFVARDQPALVKSIVEHWVLNVPFV